MMTEAPLLALSPAVVAALLAAVAISFALGAVSRRGGPTADACCVRVRDLFIYPIKGCAGMRVSRAAVTPRGLAHDRMLMVVRGSDGAFRTQRQLPALATIRPLRGERGGELVLTAPGHADFTLNLDLSTACTVAARVWGHDVPDAEDCGDAVAAWLCAALGADDLRLVRMPRGHARPVPDAAGVVSFADDYPVLLAAEASRDAVRRAAALDALDMARFRPNVVIDAPSLLPFAEHAWRRVVVGAVAFTAPGPCERCQVPRVDQTAGVADSLPDGQPTKALKELTGNHFGLNLVPEGPVAEEGKGFICVGDVVCVLKAEEK